MKKYDGLLFGNGMSLNLLQQLKKYIPAEKQYLLDINDFLKSWINGEITKREEQIVYKSLYGNKKNKWDFFEKLKNGMKLYYEQYDADIEYVMGLLLFEESELKDMFNFFPAFYNIWNIILMDYLKFLSLLPVIENYYESAKFILGNPKYIWTTNFDLFAETIKPEHIHGRFLVQIKKYEDVIYKQIDENNFYFKYVWGKAGNDKLTMINQLRSNFDYDNYFDFDFFFNNNIKMNSMLIYGMGFRKSGYIEKLSTVKPRYKKPVEWGIIDEHILKRINAMFSLGMLNHVDITYFDENEKKHLNEVLEEFGIKNYTLINCHEFDFII